ncbi:hypothetical protein D9M71_714440 [compost metagenome]
MPLTQDLPVEREQFMRRCRLQTRRDDQCPHIMLGTWQAILNSQQLAGVVRLPMTDANLWQFDCTQLGSDPIGYPEQIAQAMYRRALRAGINEHANLQSAGVVSFCRHCVDRANPQVRAQSL